jgi:hypothetical protein
MGHQVAISPYSAGNRERNQGDSMDAAVVAHADIAAQDFSLVALFLRADIIVKSVMIGLFLASIWSWAVIIDKFMAFGDLGRRAKSFEDGFARAGLNALDADEAGARDAFGPRHSAGLARMAGCAARPPSPTRRRNWPLSGQTG